MEIHVENQIEDYWSTEEDGPQHSVREYMSRDRFWILHRRFCLSAPPPLGEKLKTWERALWNDNAPTLFMMNCTDGSGTVSTPRHKPSETSSNLAVARAWFGAENVKDLDEPYFAWLYNRVMGAVDVGDQLKSYNSRDRPIRRGGWQALWNWLLHTVLVNCYLLSIHANVDDHWHVEVKDK
ncbi:hypothetical protein BKA61DRAFT_685410 [Leptodontidium sp. MPI-SDFR-AT-0119]|nr:hypothetical protein BKA61DRAFT_685410 [Leptodontidium sp. MPI-SDFR-AT-0119]